MHKILTIIALSICLPACAVAQDTAPAKPDLSSTPINFGSTYQLASSVTGQSHEINVWVPPQVEDNQRFPVLYVLDGGVEQDYLHIAGLSQLGALSWTFEAPIVVGIKTDNRRYQLTPPVTDPRYTEFLDTSGGADEFHALIEKTVIPFIEDNFPTTDRRALIGESLAGLFVVREFLRHPDTFTDYIAISPSLWWDDRALVRQAETLLAAHNDSARKLYLTMGDEGGTMQDGLDRLISTLNSTPVTNLEWTYVDRRTTETHSTIYHGAALDALRRHFGYPPYDYGETPWYLIEGGAPAEPE